MKTNGKTAKRVARRDLFDELSEGMAALAEFGGDLNRLYAYLRKIEREIADRVVRRDPNPMAKEELMAAAIQRWERAVIEEALGADAAAVLPEAIRLVELRARVPQYQREMLQVLARQEGTSVDAVLTRELEDVASAHAEELAAVMPELAMAWP
ncbi:MAG TPA: hypothetical protein VF713_12745 [Thermoanaerobaculia bacterium]